MLRHTLTVILLVLDSAPAQAPLPNTEPVGQIVWHQDFATARTLAHNTAAPLFVTFRCEA